MTAAGVRWTSFDARRGRLIGFGGTSSMGDGDPQLLAAADPTSLDVSFLAQAASALPLTAYDAVTDAHFGRSDDPDRLTRLPAASLSPAAASRDVPAPRRTMLVREAVLSEGGLVRGLEAITGGFAQTPGPQTPTPISGGAEWVKTVSRDAGSTWDVLPDPWPYGIVAASGPAGDAGATDTWFGIRNGIGVVRSVDQGRSWQPASTGIDALKVMDIDISPDFAHDRTVFATSFTTASADAADDDPTGSAWRSLDGGEHWAAVGRYAALAISPEFARHRMVIAYEHLGDRSRSTKTCWAKRMARGSSGRTRGKPAS